MATTYNTGNAIGSADPRDAYDNASNFDEFSNSSAQGFTDRRGVSRKTITGATAGYAAFNVTGAWTTATAYNVNDVWSDSGTFYLVLTDYTSGATAAADIAGGKVIVHQPKDWVVPIETIADLRAFEPSIANQQIELLGHTNPGVGGGIFWHDASDTTTADDNGVTIVTAGGKRWKRKLNGYVTPDMFGAAADYDRLSMSGTTNNSVAIQSCINFAYGAGYEVSAIGDYGYEGIIVIPDNIKISGNGLGVSGFFRMDTNNTRGIIVGTYGPGNGPDTPAAGTYYSIVTPTKGSKTVTTSTVADAGNFSVGDIVGIEGSTSLYGTFRLPNMISEVVSSNASTGAILLKDPIDDSYSGGRIVKLNDGTPSTNAVDQTGKTWPLLVAVNTVIQDIYVHCGTNTGWGAVNLSTYKTVFNRVAFDGRNAIAGNPVAKTKFNNCYGFYTNAAYEFAYYSHDTDLSGCEFKRVGDFGGTNIVAGWANTGEGAKRINLISKTVVDDTGSADTTGTSVITGAGSDVCESSVLSDKTAIFGSNGASITNSLVRWGGGNGITGFDDGRVSGNDVISANGLSSGNAILQSSGSDITEITGNDLYNESGGRAACDVVHLEEYAAAYVEGNRTYSYVEPYRRSYQSTTTESSGAVNAGEITFSAGTVQLGDIFNIDAVLKGNIGDVVSVRVNSSLVASVTLTTAGRFTLKSRLQYNGPGDSRCIYSLSVDEAGAIQSSSGLFSTVSRVAASSISVYVSGMAASSAFTTECIDIIKTATRTY